MSRIILFLFVFSIFMVNFVTAQTPPLEPGVSQKLARWRAAHYSDVRYKLNVTLEKGAPLMKGEMELHVNLSDEGAKNPLVLDYRRTQFLKDKDLPYAEVYEVNGTSIDQDSSDLPTFIIEEHIIVSPTFLKKGENVVKIKFASPIKTSGTAITRYVDKEDGAEYVYSLFVPSDASTAFPVFDQPDLKARFTLAVTTPAGWTVIGNAVKYSHNGLAGFETPVSDWKAIHSFEETKPISTYVFAFAAGDFEAFAEKSDTQVTEEIIREKEKEKGAVILKEDYDKQVSQAAIRARNPYIYVRKSQAEKFKAHEKEVFRLNREAVKYLETYFDYKFPFPKYDLVLIPEFPFGGMEHAGATFLRESSIIFPSEPTANDHISRANLIFHEAAHQWFGDTVTMRWFDDLWLKEGFAEFMAYKTLEKVMPEYNAWKAFYERNKPLAYLTDATKGTTPIYQEIPNLSAAKSAYGNIVYRKAPSFLRQAEFYLGEREFQTAVRRFLKKHQYANASWEDLVSDFARVKYDLPESGGKISAAQARGAKELLDWANGWIKQRGAPIIKLGDNSISQKDPLNENSTWVQKFQIYTFEKNPNPQYKDIVSIEPFLLNGLDQSFRLSPKNTFVFPNYQDYGYGIFLLDDKSRAYILANIRNEKDDFLRSMMWGTLWDSVREAELDPKEYVELAIKNLDGETDDLTISTILSRVSTAMNYYLSDAERAEVAPRLENLLIDKLQNSEAVGRRITFYRALLGVAATDKARGFLKLLLNERIGIKGGNTEMRPGSVTLKDGTTIKKTDPAIPLKSKDRYDIVTRLLILGDPDAPKLLAELEVRDVSDDAKRYKYAAGAGVGTKQAKEKYFNDFLNDKTISESWIESAFVPFNSSRHSELTLPYLEKALAELPNLKRSRKIFFVNGWLAAFIGGQKGEKALAVVRKFLNDNPNLDKDLQRKILENVDALERAVRIRAKYGK